MKIDEQLQQGLARAMDGLTASGAFLQPIRDEVARQTASFVSVQDRLASLESRIASLSGATVGGASNAEMSALAARVAYLEAHPAAATLTGSVADISAQTLALEKTLSVGTDARIAGDLYLDGVFHVQDMFIPGALSVDGMLNASRITAGSGSVFTGDVRVEGDLQIASRMTFASGSVLTADQLIVKGGLAIIGDVTIEGIAIFFKDVKIKGELHQAGPVYRHGE
jgi:cytoskeletal protein CcmA (bactofilin family)